MSIEIKFDTATVTESDAKLLMEYFRMQFPGIIAAWGALPVPAAVLRESFAGGSGAMHAPGCPVPSSVVVASAPTGGGSVGQSTGVAGDFTPEHLRLAQEQKADLDPYEAKVQALMATGLSREEAENFAQIRQAAGADPKVVFAQPAPAPEVAAPAIPLPPAAAVPVPAAPPSTVPAAPIPSVPTPPVPPSSGSSPQLDKHGLPWDARIHASTKVVNQTGEWKKRRGVDDALVAQVEGELRAVMAGAPAAPHVAMPPAAGIPAASPVAPTGAVPSFPEAMRKLTAFWQSQPDPNAAREATTAALKSLDEAVTALPFLAARTDLILPLFALLGIE